MVGAGWLCASATAPRPDKRSGTLCNEVNCEISDIWKEPMNWISINRSNLAAIAYDETTSTLYVRFRRGGTYSYADVPQAVFQELLAAPSKGKYHAANIKPKYRYRRK
jgi:hypothetical protein